MGTVIAMFPNTDYNKLVKKKIFSGYLSGTDENGLVVFFSALSG